MLLKTIHMCRTEGIKKRTFKIDLFKDNTKCNHDQHMSMFST